MQQKLKQVIEVGVRRDERRTNLSCCLTQQKMGPTTRSLHSFGEGVQIKEEQNIWQSRDACARRQHTKWEMSGAEKEVSFWG